MATSKKQSAESPVEAITSLSVTGFKSLNRKTTLDVRPLTILAGANSSGKSSMIQPFLLIKQTLESTFDPGALKLGEPNVRFTSTDQFFSRIVGKNRNEHLTIRIESDDQFLELTFQKRIEGGVDLTRMQMRDIELKPDMTEEEIRNLFPSNFLDSEEIQSDELESMTPLNFEITRERCFFTVEVTGSGRPMRPLFYAGLLRQRALSMLEQVRYSIHVPGLRGNPERDYPLTAIGDSFPGTFEDYTASIVSQWKSKSDGRLDNLIENLKTLNLTWKVEAKSTSDTRVEIQVGRSLRSVPGGGWDLVSIADVGIGVSQVLPVLVALIVAEPGQLVYIEQPEIHLHPRAQVALAGILADAAKRGVRVIVETHSQLLLLGVQTLVAEGKLPPESVGLNWFQRQADGSSTMIPAELDESGAFGDWPEDFADVELEAENRYLSAAEAVHFKE